MVQSAKEIAANEMQKKAEELERYKKNREQSDKNDKKIEEGKLKEHEAWKKKTKWQIVRKVK